MSMLYRNYLLTDDGVEDDILLGGPLGPAADFCFGLLPFISLIVLIVLKVKAQVALPLAVVIMLLIHLIYFRTDLNWLVAMVIAGILEPATPLSVTWGALAFFAAMAITGCLDWIIWAMKKCTKGHAVANAMLIGYCFAYLVEGASGFGTPVALSSPILTELGFCPIQAICFTLITHTYAAIFGAAGTPVDYGMSGLDHIFPEGSAQEFWNVDESELIHVGIRAQIISSILAIVIVPIAMSFTIIHWKDVLANILYIELVILTSAVVAIGIATVDVSLPSIMAGLVSMLVAGVLAMKGIGLKPMQHPLKKSKVLVENAVSRSGTMRSKSFQGTEYTRATSINTMLSNFVGPEMGFQEVHEKPELSHAASMISGTNLVPGVNMSRSMSQYQRSSSQYQRTGSQRSAFRHRSASQYQRSASYYGEGISRRSSNASFVNIPGPPANEMPDLPQPPIPDELLALMHEGEKPLNSDDMYTKTGLDAIFTDQSFHPMIKELPSEGTVVTNNHTLVETISPDEHQHDAWTIFTKTMPITLVIFILVLTRIEVFHIKPLLKMRDPNSSSDLGKLGTMGVSASVVFFLDGIAELEGVNWKFEALYSPFCIPFFMVSLWILVFYQFLDKKTVMTHSFGASMKITFIDTFLKLKKAWISLTSAMLLVQCTKLSEPGHMSVATMISSFMADSLGQGYIAFAVIIGSLGSFFSGSTTVSNVTFSSLQLDVGSKILFSPYNILAMQVLGATAGNMICLNTIINACMIMQRKEAEGTFLAVTIPIWFLQYVLITLLSCILLIPSLNPIE